MEEDIVSKILRFDKTELTLVIDKPDCSQSFTGDAEFFRRLIVAGGGGVSGQRRDPRQQGRSVPKNLARMSASGSLNLE